MPLPHRRLTALIVAGLAGGSFLVAQQSTGGLRGRVTDKATGAPKAGVQVTIEHTGTGFTRSAMSASDGSFRFPVLPIGNYKITFRSADALGSMIRTVQLGQETDCSLRMAAKAEAVVTVVATADTVDQANTSSAEVGVNVSSERLESLPVLSRNVVQATVLAAGVQVIAGSQVDPTKKASSYMTQGDGQGRGTNFNIDGGDNNSTDVGGYVSAIPMDAIGEFQVVTNQYKAEFGRSNAGFLNVVSKAGSNSFSGSVFSQFTNQSFRARSTDEGTRKDDSKLHVGATVSGPVLKDRLFYMVSGERREEEAPSSTFAPVANQLFPDTKGIQTRIDATTLYARLDWNATQWLNATLTYSFDKNETPNQSFGQPEYFNGIYNTAGLGSGSNETNRVGLKVTTNLGSSAVWESNLVYFDYRNTIRPLPDALGQDSHFYIRQRSSDPMPLPTEALGGLGFDSNSYQNTGIRRAQWRNDVTMNVGAHTWKAGLDLQRYTMADAVSFTPSTGVSVFSVANVAWGPGMYGQGVQADQNVARVLLQARNLWPGDTVKQLGAYLQDDWTINPMWAVYAGLRVDKDTCFDFMKTRSIRELYRDIYQANPSLIRGATPPENRTYVSPRLQLIYKPHGDDSAAYKIGYGRFVANVVDNITGYARTLLVRSNGIPGGYVGNQAAVTAIGASTGYVTNMVSSFAQGTVWDTFSINGNNIVLPADLTPYNYAHNVNGLQDYFRNTVDGWLLPASFATGGKQLLASNFRYPTTDTFSLSGVWRFRERHSLDLTFLFSRTRFMSTNFVADGSSYRNTGVATPEVSSWGPDLDGDGHPDNMGDSIYLSNQRAETRQLTAKYAYTSPRFNALFNLMVKDAKSTSGGAGQAFDSFAGTDFYGGGALTPWKEGRLRRSHGTEILSGSFSVAYKATWGTSFGLLGTWHGPKYYDMFLGYSRDLGPVGGTETANPSTFVGQGKGDWNLDLGLRISHTFHLGRRLGVEPFLQVQNLLNNYDYGTNYSNAYYDLYGNPNPDVGRRLFGFQANAPRTAAVGLRMTF